MAGTTGQKQQRSVARPHGDATGRRGKVLQEQQVAQAEEERNALTMTRQQESLAAQTEITDLTNPSLPQVVEVTEDESVDDLELFEQLKGSDDPMVKKLLQRFTQVKASEEQRSRGGLVQQADGKVLVRSNATFTMTYGGPDKTYEFEAGRQYRVPQAVARHMDRVGRVWH